MDTSHSKGKRLRPTGKPKSPAGSSFESVHLKSVQKGAFLISIAVKEDARPFGSLRAGEFTPNDRGRALADCWRELGKVQAGLRPDAVLIGPRHVQGILILSPEGKEAPSLSEAVRLFKVLASLRLSQTAKVSGQPAKSSGRTAGLPGPGAGDAAPGTSNMAATETSASPGKSPSALWKKGYTERHLAGAVDLAEARKALRAAPVRS